MDTIVVPFQLIRNVLEKITDEHLKKGHLIKWYTQTHKHTHLYIVNGFLLFVMLLEKAHKKEKIRMPPEEKENLTRRERQV